MTCVPCAPELGADAAGERQGRRLRGGIGRRHRQADQRQHRQHVDHRAAAGRRQDRREGAGQGQRAEVVHLHLPPRVLDVGGGDRALEGRDARRC